VLQFPDTPPVPKTHSLSCSQADFEMALTGDVITDVIIGVRDAKRAVQWFKMPRINVGRLYVAIRGGYDNRVRSEQPPYSIDTEQGRILSSIDTSGWLNVSPAGAPGFHRSSARSGNATAARARLAAR
jgi:hypothetical protein